MWLNILPLSSTNKWLRYDDKSHRKGRSQTTLKWRGGWVVKKCRLFVNVYKVNNVGGQKKRKKKLVNVVCERPLKYDALTKPTRSCGLRWWSLCPLIILFPLPFAILILHGCIHIPKLLCRFDFTALNCKANVNVKISRWYL